MLPHHFRIETVFIHNRYCKTMRLHKPIEVIPVNPKVVFLAKRLSPSLSCCYQWILVLGRQIVLLRNGQDDPAMSCQNSADFPESGRIVPYMFQHIASHNEIKRGIRDATHVAYVNLHVYTLSVQVGSDVLSGPVTKQPGNGRLGRKVKNAFAFQKPGDS